MFRKRLIGLLASILLGVTSSPAAAMGLDATDDLTLDDTVTEAAEAGVGDAATGDAAARQDPTPIIDEEMEGVGRLYVAVDEEEMSLTVGVGFEPAGIDEDITLPPAGGDEEPADEQPTAETSDDVAAAEKADMNQAKSEAAMQTAAARAATPAFESGTSGVSGSVSSGTGTGRSVRPAVVAPDPEGDTAADLVLNDSNPWLRVLGSVMLAGTAAAWVLARRYELA